MRLVLLLLALVAAQPSPHVWKHDLKATWPPPITSVTLAVPAYCETQWWNQLHITRAFNIAPFIKEAAPNPEDRYTFISRGNLTLNTVDYYEPMELHATWWRRCMDDDPVTVPSNNSAAVPILIGLSLVVLVIICS